jgi:hypothetical protein
MGTARRGKDELVRAKREERRLSNQLRVLAPAFGWPIQNCFILWHSLVERGHGDDERANAGDTVLVLCCRWGDADLSWRNVLDHEWQRASEILNWDKQAPGNLLPVGTKPAAVFWPSVRQPMRAQSGAFTVKVITGKAKVD